MTEAELLAHDGLPGWIDGQLEAGSMTEAEWLGCAHPEPMLQFLRGKASDRKLRLCACCRYVPALLADVRSRRAVEVAERFVDGLARHEELSEAQQAAIDA